MVVAGGVTLGSQGGGWVVAGGVAPSKSAKPFRFKRRHIPRVGEWRALEICGRGWGGGWATTPPRMQHAFTIGDEIGANERNARNSISTDVCEREEFPMLAFRNLDCHLEGQLIRNWMFGFHVPPIQNERLTAWNGSIDFDFSSWVS